MKLDLPVFDKNIFFYTGKTHIKVTNLGKVGALVNFLKKNDVNVEDVQKSDD